MASIIGHGLATRFPELVFMPVEFSSTWIRPFYEKLQRTYESSSVLFDEEPFEVFKRNVWVHAFHEPDPKGLIDLGLPADHVMFGSDFPHPEGMEDPLAYAAVVEGLSTEQQELIMGGSIEKVLKVGKYANAFEPVGDRRGVAESEISAAEVDVDVIACTIPRDIGCPDLIVVAPVSGPGGH